MRVLNRTFDAVKLPSSGHAKIQAAAAPKCKFKGGRLFIHFTPLEVSPVQRLDQELCSCQIRCKRNVVNIAEADDVVDVRLVFFAVAEGIAKENNEVDLVVLDLRTDLLLTAKVPCQELVNGKVGDLFHKASCGSCRIQIMSAQNAAICNAEILHQFLFCIMCNDRNVHVIPPK